jgi:hypothetical protein
LTFNYLHGPFDEPDYTVIFPNSEIIETDRVRLCYAIKDNVAYSGPGASFGGISFKSSSTLSFQDLLKAIRELVQSLKERHRNAIGINFRLAPDFYYSPEVSGALRAALEVSGAISNGEVTFAVFSDMFHPKSSVERNARKAQRAGLKVTPCTAIEAYRALSKFKEAKQYSFGFEEKTLVCQMEKYPNAFMCNSVKDGDERVRAALIEARINNCSLLIAWDQDDFGKKASAVDFLLLSRIRAAISSGANYIDLGTVSDNGRQIREGLVRHKQNFSATPYLRNTYFLEIR